MYFACKSVICAGLSGDTLAVYYFSRDSVGAAENWGAETI